MTNGSISVKLAPDYEMSAVQKQLENTHSENDILMNDIFFPNISISQFRNQARLDGTVTEHRLKDALIDAMASVNDELAPLKAEYTETAEQDGITLATIPSSTINQESILVYRYRRAVTCLALANLYERYTSYDTTNDGEKKAELLQNSINQLRRDARFAIADILKKHRVDVELI